MTVRGTGRRGRGGATIGALPTRAGAGSSLLALALLALAGCREPSGYREDARDAAAAGEAYALPRAERELPAIPDSPTPDDLLQYAFEANATLEADYHHWREALARVSLASAWDAPRLSFGYLTSSGEMRSWDRTTLEVSQGIPLAGRRAVRARQAMAELAAARHHFEGMKFAIQGRVLSGAAEYAYLGRAIDLAREDLRLAEESASLTATRLSTGRGTQADLSGARLMTEEVRNELRMLAARAEAAGADLNALLGRDASLPLPFPSEDPLDEILAGDAEIFRLAAARNHELLGMAAQAQAQRDALAYARRAWVPDLMLGYEVMGDIEARVTGLLTLPLRVGAIRAAVREASAALDAAEAHRQAAYDDMRARTVSALAMARDADRQARLFRDVLAPEAERIAQLRTAAYASAGAMSDYRDVIEARRALLALRLGEARAVAARASAMAELEEVVATDRSRWAGPLPEENE